MKKTVTLFILYLLSTSLVTCYVNLECGNSPSQIYKDLAKSIGMQFSSSINIYSYNSFFFSKDGRGHSYYIISKLKNPPNMKSYYETLRFTLTA